MSRDELRALVMGAGREILDTEGIETGTDNLTFKRVFEHIERTRGIQLTNASVIRRVWENQSDFQADVLSAIPLDHERPEIDEALAAIHLFLDGLDLSTESSRWSAITELCRVVGTSSSDSLQLASNWPLWISVVAMATTTSPSERRNRVRGALCEGYASITEFWEATTQTFMGRLGLRFRSPWSMRRYTIAATALSDGYAMRRHIEGGLEPFTRATGPDGALQEWTLFGTTMEALVLQAVELDPDFRLDGPPGRAGSEPEAAARATPAGG